MKTFRYREQELFKSKNFLVATRKVKEINTEFKKNNDLGTSKTGDYMS